MIFSTLEEFARLSGKLYLGGEYVELAPPAASTSSNPPPRRFCRVADASDVEVDQAIDIADAARRKWQAMDCRSRAVILHDIAAVIRRDKFRRIS